MTTYTSTMLANRALEVLTVVGTGQSPEDEDTQKMLGFVGGVLAELSTLDIFAVADADDIDEAAFNSIAECLAVAAAFSFGKSKDIAMREAAEDRLRVLSNRSGNNFKLKMDGSLPTAHRRGLSLSRWESGV